MKGKKITYTITFEDVGDENCNVAVEVTGHNFRGAVDCAPLVPLLNRLSQTLADDLESRL